MIATKNIAIIPARGGSVRVPRKNIRPLNGIPLIEHTIKQAFDSGVFDKVIVSTEDSEIFLISMLAEAQVIHRPKHLAEDVESELVIIHVIEELEKTNYTPDIIVMLQCTSPFRKPETIKKCVDLLVENYDKCDSVITVTNVEGNRPEWMCFVEKNNKVTPYTNMWLDKNQKPLIKLVARQDLPKLYKQNGCVYAFKRDLIMDEGVVIGANCKAIIISEEEAHDIDTELDFVIAEEMMGKNK